MGFSAGRRRRLPGTSFALSLFPPISSRTIFAKAVQVFHLAGELSERVIIPRRFDA